jgi:polyisoprenoid-binding protein YceI
MAAVLSATPVGLGLKPGTWVIDSAHSAVTFQIRHLGLSKVRGRFDTFAATLEVAESGAASVTAEIDLGSIDTNNTDRDAHLRSTDFFNTEQHPTMSFESTGVVGSGEEFTVNGNVTLNGITKPLSLKVEFNGTELFTGANRVQSGFSATGTIKRSEFGIDFGALPIGVDKLALGDDVKFELDLEFIEPS